MPRPFSVLSTLLTLALCLIAAPALAQEADGSASATGAPLPRDPEAIARALGTPALRDLYVPQFDTPHSQVSHFVIPRTIKVGITPFAHCGQWLNAGQPIIEVIEMDFMEYVKNVLPNEWPNSWHPESLKAGAMAVKTFAWWRMTLTNPRPQGADVVDNTCDQRFIRNSRRPTTDAAVDATWPYRMSRGGLIRNVHYLDTDQRCANTPALRPCMGQWGSRYMAEAGYTWEQILHHYYDPTDISLTNLIPPNTNVIKNGNFNSGAEHWNTWGSVTGANVSGGVYRFFRAAGSSEQAVLLQDVGVEVGRNTPMRVNVQLGNSSSTPKQVSVHLHSTTHWNGVISCAFTLHPNSPPLDYVMWGHAGADWPALRLEISGESADGQPYYLVDNVRVRHVTAGIPVGTQPCIEPRPGIPQVSAPTAGQIVGNTFNLVVQPGMSNYRPGYNAQFHVQVSTSPAFNTLVFHNEGALATSPIIPLTLTSGQYHLRVRQFDGLDRFSGWSPVVAFETRVFPGQPVLVGPQGAVDGAQLVFEWQPASNTDEYTLRILDTSNLVVANARITPAACGVTCIVPIMALSKPLNNGQQYRWEVLARNSDGRTRSARLSFTPNLPGTPVMTTPAADALVAPDVTLYWQAVPLADAYRLVIRIPGQEQVLKRRLTPDQAACSGGVCAVSPAAQGLTLVPGTTYEWRLIALRTTPHAVSPAAWRAFTIDTP